MTEGRTVVGVFFGDEGKEFPPEVQAQFQADADGSMMWLAYARMQYEMICIAMEEGKDSTKARQELAELYEQIDPGQMIDVITSALQILDRDELLKRVEEITARDPEWSGGK